MTGYGVGITSSENYKVTVELKSLNSKFFEMNMRVPRAYMKYEHLLRNALTRELERGKITVLMNVEIQNPTKRSLNINLSLLQSYWAEIKTLNYHLEGINNVDLEYLLGLPDVMASESVEEDEEEWKLIQEAAMLAAKTLIESRFEEGKALSNDFTERLAAIENHLTEIEALAPLRLEEVRRKLTQQLSELKEKFTPDPNRLEQEMIFYIERLDINEEIVRLKQHLSFFRKVQGEASSSGKQLSFIAQEIGREINTIGSKANHAQMQRFVVGMKDELERIKEQVLNVV